MNGKIRALAALGCQPTDHLSIFPSIDVAAAAKYLGKGVGACFADAALHARSLEAALDRHPDIDGVYINLCLTRRTAHRCRIPPSFVVVRRRYRYARTHTEALP